MTRLIAFFMMLRLQPPYALAIVVACTALGVWMTAVSPRELDSGLGLLLFVQMFMASTGFASRASSGQFDPLLVAGQGRARVAAAHWIASIAPGLIGWVLMALVGKAVGSAAAASALLGRRAAAFVIVSTLGWVLGYRLPRGAGGLAWITLLLAMLLEHESRAVTALFASAADGGWQQLAVVLCCPFILVGNRPPVSPAMLAAAVTACAFALAATWYRAHGLDVLLVERS